MNTSLKGKLDAGTSIPRPFCLTTPEREAITSFQKDAVVLDSTDGFYYKWDGAKWEKLHSYLPVVTPTGGNPFADTQIAAFTILAGRATQLDELVTSLHPHRDNLTKLGALNPTTGDRYLKTTAAGGDYELAALPATACMLTLNEATNLKKLIGIDGTDISGYTAALANYATHVGFFERLKAFDRLTADERRHDAWGLHNGLGAAVQQLQKLLNLPDGPIGANKGKTIKISQQGEFVAE